jgi:hypothetical protein
VSDAFYSPRAFLADKKVWLSAVASLLLACGVTYGVASWRLSSSVVVRPIGNVSVVPWDNSSKAKSALSVEDIKKIFENNSKVSAGDRFVVYTAPLSEICKNKGEPNSETGKQLVIANTTTNTVLGTIGELRKNCSIAAKAGEAGELLVTSPTPFPSPISSDKITISAAQ